LVHQIRADLCSISAPDPVEVWQVSVLKNLLSRAVAWEIIPVNPSQGIKLPKILAGRVRYLQPTELHNLLALCPELLCSIVGLAVSTGMRCSEILGLRWLDVDIQHGCLMLPQTKKRRPNRLPQQGSIGSY